MIKDFNYRIVLGGFGVGVIILLSDVWFVGTVPITMVRMVVVVMLGFVLETLGMAIIIGERSITSTVFGKPPFRAPHELTVAV